MLTTLEPSLTADSKSVVVPAQAPRESGLNGRRIHFMGAGGIGVSALMELARAGGAVVSGCDCGAGGQVGRLKELGIEVHKGHHASHIDDCDELVYTPAVPDDHPELVRALELGKAVSVRMRMLGRLARGTRAVCITGSHGKTTTTWLTAHLLIQAGRDPNVLVGGVVPSLGSNVRLRRGRGKAMGGELVLEVDESDNRLHEIVPTIPLLTNVDNDHMEHYGSLENLQAALTRFMASAMQSGDPLAALVACGDDPRGRGAMLEAACRSELPAFDYGMGRWCRVRGENLRLQGMSSRFDVRGPFGLWSGIELPMPGVHNILNALGALTVAWRLGLDETTIRAGLASAERVARRFEIKGIVRGVRVIDDYGHHPTELAATLRAARATTQGRVAMLFQPHRYSRTQLLLNQFAECLAQGGADAVVLLPVYAASEAALPGADSESLAAKIKALGFSNVFVSPTRADAVAQLADWAHEGDTLLVQGAGDVTNAADELVTKLG